MKTFSWNVWTAHDGSHGSLLNGTNCSLSVGLMLEQMFQEYCCGGPHKNGIKLIK